MQPYATFSIFTSDCKRLLRLPNVFPIFSCPNGHPDIHRLSQLFALFHVDVEYVLLQRLAEPRRHSRRRNGAGEPGGVNISHLIIAAPHGPEGLARLVPLCL